jgi:hypothetical protein
VAFLLAADWGIRYERAMNLRGVQIFLLAACCVVATQAHAQIDPEKRKLVQVGYNLPFEGHGPVAAYAYLYWNEPDFPRTNQTLRLAVAPIYVDGELGFRHLLGENTDFAVGLAGGGFADSYNEIHGGVFRENESFTGHGGEVSASLYHRLNPRQEIPLNFILRGAARYSIYETDDKTDPTFRLPDDRATFAVRTGLRWGGREPLLMPKLAMEVSVWYEGQFRTGDGRYGFAGDREVQTDSHLFWGRALLNYTFPELKHHLEFSLTAGVSADADRFSAYRLGALLPLASEFPLALPGYYFQEISASRFALLGGQYLVPLGASKSWSLSLFGSTAVVDYLPGLGQPGNWHSGLGGGVAYQSSSGIWQISLGYAHGFSAIRDGGRGANTVGVAMQFDLERQLKRGPLFDPARLLDRLHGLERIFSR